MAGQKGDQRNPSVLNELVVWSELAPGGTDYDIYAQRLHTNFRASGPPRLIAGGPGNQSNPDVVPNSRNGEWLVVWSDDATDAGDVLGMRISAALTSRSNVIEIAKGMGVAADPTIARDLTDKETFLVVFTDDRNGNRDLFGARVTESGLPLGGSLGGVFEVIASPEEDYAPQLIVNMRSREPGTDPGAGRLPGPRTRNLLMWTHDHLVDGPDVMGLRLNNNGLAQGGPFTIAGGPGIQAMASGDIQPSSDSREEFIIAYQDDGTGTLDIVGQDLSLSGFSRRDAWALATD
jgi:hypothetical protein